MRDIRSELELLKAKNDELEHELLAQVNEILDDVSPDKIHLDPVSNETLQIESGKEINNNSVSFMVSYLITKQVLKHFENKWLGYLD